MTIFYTISNTREISFERQSSMNVDFLPMIGHIIMVEGEEFEVKTILWDRSADADDFSYYPGLLLW